MFVPFTMGKHSQKTIFRNQKLYPQSNKSSSTFRNKFWLLTSYLVCDGFLWYGRIGQTLQSILVDLCKVMPIPILIIWQIHWHDLPPPGKQHSYVRSMFKRQREHKNVLHWDFQKISSQEDTTGYIGKKSNISTMEC